MTHKMLLASAAFGLALLQSAHAQLNPVLVAGWDFNSLNPAGLQAVSANYSDSYAGPVFPTTLDQTSAASRGTFLANGTGGSELLPLNASSGISVSATADTISRSIDTRVGSFANVNFDNANFGTTDNAIQIAARNTLNPQTIAFQVDTAGLKLGAGGLTSISLWLAKSAASNLTIDWGYKIGAGAVQSLTSSNLTSLAANTYANTIVDLSSIAVDGGLLSIIGTINSTATTVFGMRLDNTGIYGVADAAAIPEPSTYALILGVVSMGVAALRRRRQILA